MPTYFIAGVDTGIGKTFVTGLVARYFLRQGKKVLTQKLVQTGQDSSISEDILEHRRLMRIDLQPEDFRQSSDGTGVLTCPYSFFYPASPHLAARLENRTILPQTLTDTAETLQRQCDVLLIEGVGGFLVPLTSTLLAADYIAERQYPIILVTSCKLGSINHTLLTIEAIFRRSLSLACLVINQYPKEDATIGNDTFNYFRKVCSHVITIPLVEGDVLPNIEFERANI